jgi:pyrroline-5-carboxylate reductase
MARLQIIGGGRMGEALLTGLTAAEWAPPGDLRIVEPVTTRRDQLAALHPGVEVAAEPDDAEGTVVAVKPDVVGAACHALAGFKIGRVVSIAAGVTLATLEAALPEGTPVVRAMPNTPALIGAGAAAIAAGTHAGEDDLDWAEGILGAVGIVVRVPESQLDAVTGLSGSGPAYVFLVAEALVEAGVLAGLPRDVAEQLTGQTLLGAARVLVEGDEHPAVLRAAVTSPGGTTAAGLRALESAAVRAAFLQAVRDATERSRELGSP